MPFVMTMLQALQPTGKVDMDYNSHQSHLLSHSWSPDYWSWTPEINHTCITHCLRAYTLTHSHYLNTFTALALCTFIGLSLCLLFTQFWLCDFSFCPIFCSPDTVPVLDCISVSCFGFWYYGWILRLRQLVWQWCWT